MMGSSVASEWAFSAAGITISKRRNRLNANIIEALQCLKPLNSQDLMLRVSPNVADEEKLLDNADRRQVNQKGRTIDVVEAEDWAFEAVVEDTDDKFDNDNDD
jgi:hypothetical protein